MEFNLERLGKTPMEINRPYKFVITFEDGSAMESHDTEWNAIKDHCHARQTGKKWASYQLLDKYGHSVKVNFANGEFIVSDPEKTKTKQYTTKEVGPFEPIYGRRVYKGEDKDLTAYFCGWKNATTQKVAVVYPDKQIVWE